MEPISILIVLGLAAIGLYLLSQRHSPTPAAPATASGLDIGGDVATGATVPDVASADAVTVTSSPDFSTRIQQWAQAIFHMEGGNANDLNVRNNNPGNLKVSGYAGQVGTDQHGFAIFDSLASGFTALEADLEAAVSKYPNFSLLQFTTHYLGGDPTNPQITNQGNPFAYSDYVARQLGVNSSNTLSQIFGG